MGGCGVDAQYGVLRAGLGGGGRPAKAGPVLRWVLSKRNALGELPEKVDGAGRPASVAPLAWTGSIVVLSLVALEAGGLSAPPLSLQP